MLTGENGILTQAQNAKEATENAEREEKQNLENLANSMENLIISKDGYNSLAGVNEPKLRSGMIPVKWNGSLWVKADKNNTNYDWYQYGTTTNTKKWANIVTVKANGTKTRLEYENAEVGTEINQEDITTMFVWIPRYSYKIANGYQTPNEDSPATTNSNSTKNIEITFLKGNTNIGSDGVTYNKDGDTTQDKIVHPGFTMGDVELRGIWVAKFEASGLDSEGNAVGNISSTSSDAIEPDSSTYVRILPSKISWRHISAGESQYQSIQMSADNGNDYGWNSVNSHLIKNSEWGAVAYLSYSEHGNVMMSNGSISKNSNGAWYNIYTGAGPNTNNSEEWYGINNTTVKNGGEFTESVHGYNTENGMLSSTTGNIYGIYDIAGGSWERVAGYLDNGNSKLSTNGKIYFAENENTNRIELKSEYSAYWDSYEVSEEEYNNEIVVDGEGTFTQEELWNENYSAEQYNEARRRITGITYQNMARHKGIGVNEVSNGYSYYGIYNNGSTNTWGLFQTVKQATEGKITYAIAWNNDYILMGNSSVPFLRRGGYAAGTGIGAGALALYFTNGEGSDIVGFRPALAF